MIFNEKISGCEGKILSRKNLLCLKLTKIGIMLKTDGMCTQCTMYRSIVLFFFNVDINEYTFDIFEKPILQVLQKKS